MKGIMFTENLFSAVVDGRKTQTRRVIKDATYFNIPPSWDFIFIDKDGEFVFADSNRMQGWSFKPRYSSGETLYLKEPYRFDKWDNIEYAFDIHISQRKGLRFQTKLFMPEKYARHFIQIISVKAERLQDISARDIRNEGVPIPKGIGGDTNLRLTASWVSLWNGINKTPYSWEENPWVWVYEFRLKK